MAAALIAAGAVLVTLLDTKVENELGWTTFYTVEGNATNIRPWKEATYVDQDTQDLFRVYAACTVEKSTIKNWLRTPYLERQGANELWVEIQFTMRACTEYPDPDKLKQCKESFKLLYYQAESDIANAERPTWDVQTYHHIDTIAADETWTSSDQGPIPINSELRRVPVTLNGVYFTFLDEGSCSSIISVRVYYLKCPAVTIDLAFFQETATRETAARVTGKCVENSAGEGLPYYYCQSNGRWEFPATTCNCMPRYEPDDGKLSCRQCPVNTFKQHTSNDPCSVCPAFSEAKSPGSFECSCLPGYYRAEGDNKKDPCTKPPSSVLNLNIVYGSGGRVNITWDQPSDLGGRRDLSYRVECSECDQMVVYNPRRSGFNSTWVSLTGLPSSGLIDVFIYADNGVSALAGMDANNKQRVQVNTTLAGSQRGWLTPVAEAVSGNTIVLRWQSSPTSGNSPDMFEVRYFPSGRPTDVLHKRTSVPNMTLMDLLPDTAYVISIRARTNGAWSDYSEATEAWTPSTTDGGVPVSSGGGQNVGIIVGSAVAVIICLIIVALMAFIFFRRSQNQCNEKGMKEDTLAFQNVSWLPAGVDGSPAFPHHQHLTLPLFTPPLSGHKTYIDPHTYEDPNQAVREFTKEIDQQFITIESVIGGGEFGDVCKGKLRLPSRAEVTVAIKTLKTGASDKNRLDFLTEASIMGQFEDPNIVFLEGVVTKSQPNMIVMEYMENGALDNFLRKNDGRFTALQLVQMLNGIASGMKYLSEMSYIHRDLAARNILIDAQLVCKVADFGLSREIESDENSGAYTTKGGKIPVRWTAPEAIAYRKFTSASDVWSYGVVMWEVMSYGERPYWNWSNQDVIRAVDKGFRLPPPMGCPQHMYELMLKCWMIERNQRPRFCEIVPELDMLILHPDSLCILEEYRPHQFINPNRPDLTNYESVPEWLHSLKMERYLQNFQQAGCVSMDQVANLTADDLESRLGVTLMGHKKKILSSIQSLRAFTMPMSSSEVSYGGSDMTFVSGGFVV